MTIILTTRIPTYNMAKNEILNLIAVTFRPKGNNTAAEIVNNFQRVVEAAMADESRGSTTRMPAGSSNTSSSTSTTTSSTLQGPTNSTPRGTPCGSDNCQR